MHLRKFCTETPGLNFVWFKCLAIICFKLRSGTTAASRGPQRGTNYAYDFSQLDRVHTVGHNEKDSDLYHPTAWPEYFKWYTKKADSYNRFWAGLLIIFLWFTSFFESDCDWFWNVLTKACHLRGQKRNGMMISQILE